MKSKKGIIITTIVVLLLLVVGVTYAFFTYESDTKSDIVTGQIYMNYEETSTISLTGVFPETKEQALARQDENGVFEFTITGRNTSKYPVYYEIDLLEGGVITGKTEQSTKIAPDDVRIYLERDGEVLVDGMAYKDWNNRRIYVDTVPANQATNIEHKYTLRMWIDENVTISDTDPNADYTTSEWNDAYTSLKVRVVGDFEGKEVTTNASCFAYNVITSDITYDYPIITLDTSEEKVEACMAVQMNLDGTDISTAQDGYQSFCEGTGTIAYGGKVSTLKEEIALMYSGGTPLEEIQEFYPVVQDITSETRYYELNTSEESVNACKEYMLNDVDEGNDYSFAQDGYQSFCEGIDLWEGFEGDETIFDLYKEENDGNYNNIRLGLIERNVFTQVETPQGGEIEITNYDEETCGTDVIIPSTIEGLPVTRIADGNRDEFGDIYSGVFYEQNLSSIKFPDTMKYIGDGAFMYNSLEKIVIPNNVTYIGERTFYSNPLVNVKINDNPVLGFRSFSPFDGYSFQTFQYGGTCEELNRSPDIFNSLHPRQIITSDNIACEFTNER